MATIIKVANEQEIVRKLSSYIEKISNDAILNRGKFFVGLSGKIYTLFCNNMFLLLLKLVSY